MLVDGAEPTVRVAALLYGSGMLPHFDRDIPWTSPVIARAEELKEGTWGAGAAAEAVARTVAATIVNKRHHRRGRDPTRIARRRAPAASRLGEAHPHRNVPMWQP
ncbi:hypothetical protein [Phytoactinopolyspora endophytica]|uniref:hypothetical protein n=1 Tax=Phytoactinopolyspora endophytica TaxID=1642495 RepID=UPI00197B8CF9|nr:hypothetical protein [Phytoactinopolyspora endophytica]